MRTRVEGFLIRRQAHAQHLVDGPPLTLGEVRELGIGLLGQLKHFPHRRSPPVSLLRRGLPPYRQGLIRLGSRCIEPHSVLPDDSHRAETCVPCAPCLCAAAAVVRYAPCTAQQVPRWQALVGPTPLVPGAAVLGRAAAQWPYPSPSLPRQATRDLS